jgi:hypothetical protein
MASGIKSLCNLTTFTAKMGRVSEQDRASRVESQADVENVASGRRGTAVAGHLLIEGPGDRNQNISDWSTLSSRTQHGSVERRREDH